jgi:hypothetical protein
MRITVYGKRGNEWTDRVRAALMEAGIGHELVEEFEWARDPETCKFLPPYEEDGKVFIPKMPTMRLHDEADTWADGLEACTELIGALRVGLHKL